MKKVKKCVSGSSFEAKGALVFLGELEKAGVYGRVCVCSFKVYCNLTVFLFVACVCVCVLDW